MDERLVGQVVPGEHRGDALEEGVLTERPGGGQQAEHGPLDAIGQRRRGGIAVGSLRQPPPTGLELDEAMLARAAELVLDECQQPLHGIARLSICRGDPLGDRERDAYLGGISRAADSLAEVDAMWYIRGKVALLFEVEWTAILGDAMLRRHVRIGDDERLVRFLVIAPERTDLVRYKLERSPLLRQAMADGGWNILKSNHLRAWLAADRPDLATLEPLLGLDPLVERSGEQMPLFNQG